MLEYNIIVINLNNMGVRSKTLLTVVLTGVLVGVFTIQVTNPDLFKGQIFNQGGGNEIATTTTTEPAAKPDLIPKLEIIAPTTESGDMKVDATIENIGEGDIAGGTTFTYGIYLNDIEVFTNSDSFTSIAAGDSFNFQYPISKPIYQYPNQGKIRFSIDLDDSIEESNENNNEVTLEYSI